MAHELSRSDRFIYEVLSSSVDLAAIVGDRIYSDVAPEGTAYPFVVFQVQSDGSDRRDVGGRRILVDPLYLVKVYDAATSWRGDLEEAADAIDAVLARVQATPVGEDGSLVVGCIRESPFRLVEDEVRSVGGMYRVWIQVPE